MSAVYLHLVVNHFAIVGTVLALPLVLLALWRRDERAYLVSAALLLAISAGAALVASRSGEAAEDVVEKLPGVLHDSIELHEERAEVATVLAVIAGVGAVGLAALRSVRGVPLPRAAVLVLLAGVLGSAAAMVATGAAGGRIRHTELTSPEAGAPEPAQGAAEHDR